MKRVWRRKLWLWLDRIRRTRDTQVDQQRERGARRPGDPGVVKKKTGGMEGLASWLGLWLGLARFGFVFFFFFRVDDSGLRFRLCSGLLLDWG
jgi:hypothetical protein